MFALQSAYGLRIAADIPLPGLPVQPAGQVADVRIRLKNGHAFPSSDPAASDEFLYVSPNLDQQGFPSLRVAKSSSDGYIGFFYSDGIRFAIDPGISEVFSDWPETLALEDACIYLLGPVLAFLLRLRGATCLHASAIALEDRAIALFGTAGAGKSTTAAAFALRGYPVLSDDVAVLADRGDHFLVQPGYPRVNLWPDSVRMLFGSGAALPRITPTWDKQYLPLDQNGWRFQSSPLPLSAIYILGERDPSLAAPVIEGVAGGQALVTLVANTYVNYLLDREMRAHEFQVLSRLLAGVPVRRVRPAADPSKVFALCECIAADAKKLATSGAARAVQQGC